MPRSDRTVVEILPGAEAAARAGEHHHARVAEVLQGIAELLVHLHGEAVESVRAVQCDADDRIASLEQDSLVIGHEPGPSRSLPTREGLAFARPQP